MGATRDTSEIDDALAPLLPLLLDESGPMAHFLFDRRHRLRQHIARLHRIVIRIERLTKRTRVANVAGSCLGAAGATAAVVGLSLSPVTLGASLLASAVGIAVAAAGGATNVASDLSAALCSARELKRVRVIAQDSRQLVEESLLRLELVRQEYGLEVGGGTISLGDCTSFALLFGAHDFMVPKSQEAASKVGQAVLKAKTQRLAQTIESCTQALDAICLRLLVGDEEQGRLQHEYQLAITGKDQGSRPVSALWGGHW